MALSKSELMESALAPEIRVIFEKIEEAVDNELALQRAVVIPSTGFRISVPQIATRAQVDSEMVTWLGKIIAARYAENGWIVEIVPTFYEFGYICFS